MKYDETLYELIDRFLAGEMDAEALKEFEARMEREPELAEEVRLQQEVADAVLDTETRDFELQLKRLGERMMAEASEPDGSIGSKETAGLGGSDESTGSDGASADRESSDLQGPTLGAKPSRNPWMRYIAVAAGLALLVTVGFFLLRDPAEQTSWVTSGDQQTKILSDSSKVTLLANSSLSYQEGFAKDARSLSLEGAAHFEVAKDAQRPFSVSSGKIRATVLGTSFTLRAYPAEDTTWLAVYEGKVSFGLSEDVGDNGLVLEANETAGWTEATGFFKLKGIHIPDPVIKTETGLSFKNTPLSEVAQVVGEYYGVEVRVELEETPKCNLTGKFDSPAAQTTIEDIAFTLGLESQNEGDTVFVLTGVCQ